MYNNNQATPCVDKVALIARWLVI